MQTIYLAKGFRLFYAFEVKFSSNKLQKLIKNEIFLLMIALSISTIISIYLLIAHYRHLLLVLETGCNLAFIKYWSIIITIDIILLTTVLYLLKNVFGYYNIKSEIILIISTDVVLFFIEYYFFYKDKNNKFCDDN